MKKHITYRQLISGYNESQDNDFNSLWKEMKHVLDLEIPVEKEKKRFFADLFISQLLFASICLGGALAMSVHIQTSNSRNAANFSKSLLPVSIGKDGDAQQQKIDSYTKSYNLYLQGNSTGTQILSTQPPNNRNISHLPASSTQILKSKNDIYSSGVDTNKILSRYAGQLIFTKTQKHTNKNIQFLKIIPSLTHTSVPLKSNSLKSIHNEFAFSEPSIQLKHNSQNRYIQPQGMYTPSYNVTQHSRHNITGSTITWQKDLLSKRTKGFVAGLGMNFNLPVSSQEMSTVSMNGEKSSLWDYLPSVYAQYHFNNRLFIQSEFQFVSPQHTPQLQLFNKKSDVTVNAFKENEISLHKLYYLNIPVSVYYCPIPNLYVGAGLQYSYLKKSIFIQEVNEWENGVDGWKMKSNSKTVHVKSNSVKERKINTRNANANNGNSNGNGGNSPSMLPANQIDTVLQNITSSDWRWLCDVNYNLRRFNAGVRFNMGLHQYINTKTANVSTPVQDRNKSFLVYIRYAIADKRRR